MITIWGRGSLRIAVLMAAALGACSSDQPAEAFTVSDSAGVSIAISHEPLWPEGGGWQLGGQPSVVIGGGVMDSTELVGPVAGAFRLPDGRLLVADAGSMKLLWYSDAGNLEHEVGRTGDGPGEFRSIDGLLHVGDSIAVVDMSLRRLSTFDLNGNFGRSVTLKNPPGEVFPPAPIGRLASGAWIALVTGSHDSREASRPVRDSVQVWLISDSGDPLRQLVAFPGDDKLVFASPDFVGDTRPPFGRTTTIRFHDGQLWVGTGDAFQLDLWGLNSQLQQSVRWADAPPSMTQADFGRVSDSVRASFAEGDPQWRAIGAEITKALDMWRPPPRGPAFGGFILDDDGNLWVSGYALEGSVEPVTWHVLGSDRRLQGSVMFPPLVVPTHVSSDDIVGIWTDPDGAEHVVAYPLIRDSSSM